MKPFFAFVIRYLVALVGAGLISGSIARASSLSVTTGQSVQLAVAAQGSQPFSYQWQKNGTAISGATSATYTIASATTADSATYVATVSNSAGSTVSDNATLTVNAVAVIAPSITTQPTSLTVTAGQSASFSITASGSATLTYQWKKNGTAISGATSSTYTIAATTSANAASYTVVVTNAVGSATSNAASLTVSAALIAPAITTQPTSLTVTAGQSASFSIAASGSATLTYQWKKNGTAISGATSSTYTIATTTSTDAASYTVVVTNSVGSATSNAASLTVNAALVAPAITTQPKSLTVTAGQSASFSVAASGSATLTYQWKKNSTAISGATSATFTIAATTSTDAASYTVVVTNAVGSATSNTASLTVNAAAVAPAITTQPTSLTVTAGQSAAFSVAASGSATLTYQWKKNGTAISGATSSTYTIAATTSTDAASYTVVVTNAVGSATSNAASLTVNAAAVAPAITTQPTSLTVTAGQSAAFSATASGTATLYYQWYKNGTAISGATSSTYTIAATTSADAASYSVVVNNTAGSVTSNSATLTVNAAVSLVQLTPQIVTARGQNTPAEGIAQLVDGNTATKWLDFSATTWVKVVFASPSVLQGYSLTSANDVPTRDPASWTLSGSSDGTNWTVIETRTGQSWSSRFLTRDFVLAAPSGAFTQFRFDFVAASGSITQLAELEMYGQTQASAPTISTQPASLTVNAGQSASFSIAASGSATLTYQWKKNGTAISGATGSTYIIAATTSADTASYSVVVSNSAGSVTSTSATLTVNAANSLVELTPQTVSARGQNSPVEGIAQLVDGNTATKWLDFSATTWVKVVFASPTVLQAYSLTSANDFPERDPSSWTLSGSNDGTNWTVIETRTGQSWSSRFLTRDFVLAAPSGAFTQFRFDLVAASGSITQLSELEMYGSSVVSVQLAPKSYSARGQASSVLAIANLFDGKASTQWADLRTTSWVKIVTSKTTQLRRYTLTSASDHPERDPASWTLSGSSDGINWTVIETRSSQTWSSRGLTREFVLAAPGGSFIQFRFSFQAQTGSSIQLADLQLFGSQ